MTTVKGAATGKAIINDNSDIPYFFLTISTLCISIVSLALPIMTLQIYDRVLPHDGQATLFVLTAGVCIAIILETILRLCREYMVKWAGAAFEHKLGCAAFWRIIDANLAVLSPQGIGHSLNQLGATSKIKDYHSGQVYIIALELIFVPLYLGFIFYISFVLGLIPIAILCLFLGFSIANGRSLRTILEVRESKDNNRFDFLIEALNGIHVVKANALEPFFQRRYEAYQEDTSHANYTLSATISKTINLAAICSNVMMVSIIGVGAVCVLNGDFTTGSLIACLLLAGRVMQPVQRALGLWVQYQDYMIARAQVDRILSTNTAIYGQNSTDNDRTGTIKLDAVSFQYPQSESSLLSDVNLDLKSGQSILISGAYGVGKTTFLNLLSGVYPAETGTISVDGRPIADYTQTELARRIGYIRSRAVIFRGTIRDNMTCFGRIEDAKAREVAALLNLDTDIAALPGGYDTFLAGDNTDTIPPGMKQRIAIVRTLAEKPRIIIYDNADQALDKDGYRTMYDLLARLKGMVTLILVSNDHNIQTLADDHYIVAEGGLHKDNNRIETKNILPYKELRL